MVGRVDEKSLVVFLFLFFFLVGKKDSCEGVKTNVGVSDLESVSVPLILYIGNTTRRFTE